MPALHRWLDSVWYGRHPARWLLWPLSLVYRWLVAGRRACYRRGLIEIVDVGVPVVVVGNVAVGGTGKTPCVIWLAKALAERGLRVGIISRGYGGRAGNWPQWVTPESDPGLVGDEPVLLSRRTVCPVVVGPERVAAARELLSRAAIDVLLADDGLQHYRLARSFELAVVDGERGLGNGHCLPAGPLREPPGRLEEVDAVLVNGGEWGGVGVYRARLEAAGVYRLDGCRRAALEAFRGKRVHAVAGIGRPQRFFSMLASAGIDVIPHPLPDHAVITAEDLSFSSGEPVFVTEKDAVKCRGFAHRDLWCIAVELEFERDHGAVLVERIVHSVGDWQRA